MAAGPGAAAAGLAAAAAGFLGSMAGPGAIAAGLAAAAGFLGSMAAGLAGIGAGAEAPAYHMHDAHGMHQDFWESIHPLIMRCNSPFKSMHLIDELARVWACRKAFAD